MTPLLRDEDEGYTDSSSMAELNLLEREGLCPEDEP